LESIFILGLGSLSLGADRVGRAHASEGFAIAHQQPDCRKGSELSHAHAALRKSGRCPHVTDVVPVSNLLPARQLAKPAATNSPDIVPKGLCADLKSKIRTLRMEQKNASHNF
jgi:hypothetical protein